MPSNTTITQTAITLDNVNLHLGKKILLSDLNFSVERGSVTALLGHNGAGKSSTLKSIMGLMPYTGKIEVFGIDVKNNLEKTNQLVSYLGEANPLYDEMYVTEYLKFICKIHNVPSDEIGTRITKAVSACSLCKVQNKKIKELSKGYRQRVGIAKTIVRDSQILILDEPTNALDRVNIDEARDLIKFISHTKTILISTHLVEEIEKLCTDAIVLKNGAIYRKINLKSIHNESNIICETYQDVEKDFFDGIVHIENIELIGKNRYKIIETDNSDILKQIAQRGIDKKILITTLYKDKKNFADIIKDLIT